MYLPRLFATLSGMDETTDTAPAYQRSGWGKPMGARTWHFFTTHAPGGEWLSLVSLCGKWDAEIYASGKPSVMLWPGIPPSYSIYGRCRGCERRHSIPR